MGKGERNIFPSPTRATSSLLQREFRIAINDLKKSVSTTFLVTRNQNFLIPAPRAFLFAEVYTTSSYEISRSQELY